MTADQLRAKWPSMSWIEKSRAVLEADGWSGARAHEYDVEGWADAGALIERLFGERLVPGAVVSLTWLSDERWRFCLGSAISAEDVMAPGAVALAYCIAKLEATP